MRACKLRSLVIGHPGIAGQLQANPVRIEEIDRVDEFVIGDTENWNAFGFEAQLGILQFVDGTNSERQMVDPRRRVGRRFGFLIVAAARSFGLIPKAMLIPLATTASLLTTVSMAALGLGVDVRVVADAGIRVTAAVTASLVVLGVISLGLIRLLGIA